VLNKIDTGAAHEQSYGQYLKTIDELYNEFRVLFSDKYDDNVFYDMCSATTEIIENATAAYDLTTNYAPKYDMTDAELIKYRDTLTMFHQLIEDGFKRLVPDGEEEEYRKRVEYEKYVIESTDNVDYILIQRDELNWAQENGILTGIGRGSAGGCLLLYLLGITSIDPIKYNLIFERFLLPERAGLERDKVTIMAEDIQSSNYYEITFENNQKLSLDKDAELVVNRNGERMTIYADELQSDDDIQFDNCDLLHVLPKILSHED
jgi:DNA polymerase-3 subunit alpha